MTGVALAAPVARIVAPESGAKLRKGQSLPVVIEVSSSEGSTWELVLESAESAPAVLARGSAGVHREAVVTLEAGELVPGARYRLLLSAEGSHGSSASGVTVVVPDPEFTLIPLRMEAAPAILTVDGPGRQVLFAPALAEPLPLTILHHGTGRRDTIFIRQHSTSGFTFSGDGRRLFFFGGFAPPSWPMGIGYVELASGLGTPSEPLTGKRIDPTRRPFNVDDSGERVAYLAHGPPGGLQHFLFDESTDERRQLTHTPDLVAPIGCADDLGIAPLITADGSKVVFLTPADLGIAPPDSQVRCRIFSYEVATETLTHVADLPGHWNKTGRASLSGDGRWLSFAAVVPFGSGGSRAIPVLVDIEVGTISAPFVDTGTFTSFDATVTRDGNAVIISTQADLDPRVGNADHNLELFYVDRISGDIHQITETVGGIWRNPGGCSPFNVGASRDGSLLVFGFAVISVESCRIDGPQLDEETGMWLRRVRAVRKRPGNNEVVLQPVEEQIVAAGQDVVIHFSAHDEDGDPITYYAQAPHTTGIPDILPGSSFVDHFDGTATFRWRPGPAHAGTNILRVAAYDDGGGESFQEVLITVVADRRDEEPPPCAGACNDPDSVRIDDILTLVNIALGQLSVESCGAGDIDVDGRITVDEILTAVRHALEGCPR